MSDDRSFPASIRQGAVGDRRMLLDIQHRASQAGYPEPLRSFLGAHPEVIDENFRIEWLANDQVRVASLGEQLVGFAVLERMKDQEVEITSLFVDPANWRAGIGRALIDAMAKLAIDWGHSRLFVLANPIALGFYEAVGFVHDSYVDTANTAAVPRLIRSTR